MLVTSASHAAPNLDPLLAHSIRTFILRLSSPISSNTVTESGNKSNSVNLIILVMSKKYSFKQYVVRGYFFGSIAYTFFDSLWIVGNFGRIFQHFTRICIQNCVLDT